MINKIYNTGCNELMDEMIKNNIFADLIIADPPYNYSNHESTLKRSKYKNQLRVKYFGDWDMDFDQTCWLDNAYNVLGEGGQMIIFNGFHNFGTIINYLSKYKDLEFKRQLVWKKTNPQPSNRDRLYVNSTEFMLWIVKGRGWTFNRQKDTYETGIFEYPSVSKKARVHPNQKPEGLIEELMKIHSNEGQLILDPFGGSFVTTKVAMKLGRNFISCDKDKTFYSNAVGRFGWGEQHEYN